MTISLPLLILLILLLLLLLRLHLQLGGPQHLAVVLACGRIAGGRAASKGWRALFAYRRMQTMQCMHAHACFACACQSCNSRSWEW